MDNLARHDFSAERLYRIVCEAELREAAEIIRNWHPAFPTYDAERRIIAAYKNEKSA